MRLLTPTDSSHRHLVSIVVIFVDLDIDGDLVLLTIFVDPDMIAIRLDLDIHLTALAVELFKRLDDLPPIDFAELIEHAGFPQVLEGARAVELNHLDSGVRVFVVTDEKDPLAVAFSAHHKMMLGFGKTIFRAFVAFDDHLADDFFDFIIVDVVIGMFKAIFRAFVAFDDHLADDFLTMVAVLVHPSVVTFALLVDPVMTRAVQVDLLAINGQRVAVIGAAEEDFFSGVSEELTGIADLHVFTFNLDPFAIVHDDELYFLLLISISMPMPMSGKGHAGK